MADAFDARIRIPDRIARGDVIQVTSIVSHPMDTGFFRSASGEPIPAYFIKDVVVTYDGKEIARFVWTSGISRDPVVSFTLRADKEAPLAMTWTDTRGEVVQRSVDVRFG